MSLLRLSKQPLAPHLRDSEFLGYSLAAGSEYITPSREGLDLKTVPGSNRNKKQKISKSTGASKDCQKGLSVEFLIFKKKLSP